MVIGSIVHVRAIVVILRSCAKLWHFLQIELVPNLNRIVGKVLAEIYRS